MHIEPPFFLPSEAEGGTQYRLYFLSDDGHISRVHEFFADSDAAAIKIAEGWRERAMELWSGDRKVKTWA